MKLNLIDIGATGGLEAPWRTRPGLIGTVLAFEPNEPPSRSHGRINYDTAVWNYDGEAAFTIYGEGGTGSSLLPQNVEWVRANFDRLKNQGDAKLANTWMERAAPKGQFHCRVERLDTVLKGLREENPATPRFHFLKSDTQSGEWFVLDGARQYLAEECLGVELECFRYPLYEGLKTEDEVFRLMDGFGFERVGWTGYKNSFNSQADYLFLRRNPSAADRPLVDAIRKLYRPQGAEGYIKTPSIPSRAKAAARRVLSYIS